MSMNQENWVIYEKKFSGVAIAKIGRTKLIKFSSRNQNNITINDKIE